jgi:hypothetical protein
MEEEDIISFAAIRKVPRAERLSLGRSLTKLTVARMVVRADLLRRIAPTSNVQNWGKIFIYAPQYKNLASHRFSRKSSALIGVMDPLHRISLKSRTNTERTDNNPLTLLSNTPLTEPTSAQLLLGG